MKYKIFTLAALIFCLLVLFACSFSQEKKTTKTSSYTSSYIVSSYAVDSVAVSSESTVIEEEKAKDITLSKFNLSGNSVNFDAISLTTGENPVYTVDVTKDDTIYTCSIDAKTGEVISTQQTPIHDVSSSSLSSKKNGYVGEEYVKQLVLARLDMTSSDNITVNFNEDTKTYEGNIRSGNSIYNFAVNAVTGEFINWKISKAE